MQPLISVIVPVYNVERYVMKCVKSILAQTYDKIEVILVDDGSQDASGLKCDQLALKDNRVKVLHTPNAGVSSARNKGMDLAQGVYYVFVDSDDCLPKNAIQILIDSMKHTAADMVCGAWEKIYVKGTIVDKNRRDVLIETRDRDQMLKFTCIEEVNGPVAKLYKADIIKKCRLRFPSNIKIGEDAIFNYNYLKFSKRVFFTPKIVYSYNKLNAESVTHVFDSNMIFWSLLCAKAQAAIVSNDNDILSDTNAQQVFLMRFISVLRYIVYYLNSDDAVKNIQLAYTTFGVYINKDCVSKINLDSGIEPLQILTWCNSGNNEEVVRALQVHSRKREKSMFLGIKKYVLKPLRKIRIFYFNHIK